MESTIPETLVVTAKNGIINDGTPKAVSPGQESQQGTPRNVQTKATGKVNTTPSYCNKSDNWEGIAWTPAIVSTNVTFENNQYCAGLGNSKALISDTYLSFAGQKIEVTSFWKEEELQDS